MRGRKPYRIVLDAQEEEVLRSHLQTGKTAWVVARRARILLGMAGEEYPCQIAAAVGCTARTVARVCRRFEKRRLEALHDASRSGRPRSISPPR